MKRKLALLIVAAMTASLVACGSDSSKSAAEEPAEEEAGEEAGEEAAAEEEEGEEAAEEEGEAASADGDLRFVFLVKNSNSDFWVSMGDYAVAKGKELGVTVEMMAPVTPESNEEQIQLLEQSLLDPPDAYIIVPADSAGITPAIEKINDAGIPILNVNTKFSDESVDCIGFVAIDNYETAYASSKASAEELLNGEGNVLILEGTTGSQTSIDREEGADDAFGEFSGINVLAKETANFARAEAMTVTQNLLQKYDDVDLIYATSGEMALGAYQAVEQAGRADEIQIGTINAFGELIEAWCDGKIDLTFDDTSWHQGEVAVEVMYDYLVNGVQPEEHTVIDAVEVTIDDIPKYIEMFNLDIDLDNLGRDQ